MLITELLPMLNVSGCARSRTGGNALVTTAVLSPPRLIARLARPTAVAEPLPLTVLSPASTAMLPRPALRAVVFLPAASEVLTNPALNALVLSPSAMALLNRFNVLSALGVGSPTMAAVSAPQAIAELPIPPRTCAEPLSGTMAILPKVAEHCDLSPIVRPAPIDAQAAPAGAARTKLLKPAAMAAAADTICFFIYASLYSGTWTKIRSPSGSLAPIGGER